MRSYYSHLETAMGTKTAMAPRPTLRASAIFPVLRMPGISSRVLFMGYWMLKRNIKQIAAVATLRSTEGTILHRQTFTVEEPKTYRVELEDMLKASGFSDEDDFTGSLEIEFFSIISLVFPYPAVVINYYGPKFSAVVHTAQRIYNDYEDMRKNSQTAVPESGFNIYADGHVEPFIGLINGTAPVEDCRLELEFYNSEGDVLTHNLDLGTVDPYQTQMLYPARFLNLKDFLKGKVGVGKLHFRVNGIFPRLLVGNIDHSLPAMTITHTYYDCSDAQSDSDYWQPAPKDWYPASLMIPACVKAGEFTNSYFYPIYSPSEFTIDLDFYDGAGKLMGRKEKALLVKSPNPDFFQLPLRKVCEELGIVPKENLAARLSARPVGNNRLPARIKTGLDIGSSLPNMPCNICTNLQPYVSAWETKPSSFHWAPILADQPESQLWIMNTSPAVNSKRPADIRLNFYREKDTQTIERTLSIPAYGFLVIDPRNDNELNSFFEGVVGWCTIVSSNPYTTGYYLAKNPSGVVGGDHCF